MRTLLCFSGLFGGTDLLLERYYQWAKNYGYNVEKVSLSQQLEPSGKDKAFELVILPSSQMGDLLLLRKKGYQFSRILIWIMGMGSFRDTYYNPDRNFGIEKIINYGLKYEADCMLKKLYELNSICFTDEVGQSNTFETATFMKDYSGIENIMPIGIKVPSQSWKQKANSDNILRLCWIGRVSKDFKLLPLLTLIKEMDKLAKKSKKDYLLTIVGSGDGLADFKEQVKTCKNIIVNYINYIEYDKIGEFLRLNADILIAMGTSALDGAKIGCPTVVISPTRPSDVNPVNFRWIYESKGYSLGEYPSLDVGPIQLKKTFETIMEEYENTDINILSNLSYNYSKEFSEDVVFLKLANRSLPKKMTFQIWKHIHCFSFIKNCKKTIKRCLH